MTKSINAAIAALLLIVFIGLACGDGTDAPSSEDGSAAPETAAAEETVSEPEDTVEEDEPEELPETEIEETPVPTRAAPERIRFQRGATEGTIRFSLAPGEIKTYVVGVAPAQYFHVGMDDERLDISLPSRARLTEINKGDSYVDGVTISTGDIVFEIRNPTRNSIRTFAIVTIQDREPMDH